MQAEVVRLGLPYVVKPIVGDFTKIDLPRTTIALLDNPDEKWFYDPQTGAPFTERKLAEREFRSLSRLANKSELGLIITTYFHDGIIGLASLMGTTLETLGEGFPYIWPDGRVDQRKTMRYRINCESQFL